MSTERTYGVTPPISTALPSEDEKRANEALAKELRAQGTFEPPSETQKREDILKRLQKMADEFKSGQRMRNTRRIPFSSAMPAAGFSLMAAIG